MELAEYYKSLHDADPDMEFRFTSNILKTIPDLQVYELTSLLNKNSKSFLGPEFELESS